jgi:hypothetical protein
MTSEKNLNGPWGTNQHIKPVPGSVATGGSSQVDLPYAFFPLLIQLYHKKITWLGHM